MLISLTELEGNEHSSFCLKLGCVVCHRLYGYRGVVVSVDPYCMAGDTWYHSNKTQ
ncbi:MAG: hemimethylated DNA-binding YccV-like domain-containing protein, partial [Opitutales bacterium]